MDRGVIFVPTTVVHARRVPKPVLSTLAGALVDLSPVKPVKQSVQAILRFTDAAYDHVLLSGGLYRFKL